MVGENVTLRAAVAKVRRQRPSIRPNDNFMRQLVAYERLKRGSNSIKAPVCPDPPAGSCVCVLS